MGHLRTYWREREKERYVVRERERERNMDVEGLIERYVEREKYLVVQGWKRKREKKFGIFLMGYDMYITYGSSKFRGLPNLGVSSHCLNDLRVRTALHGSLGKNS